MKKTLEKRLKYLFSGELTSLIVFLFLSYLLNSVYPNLHLYSLGSFWISFFLLEFLLLQGTIYWHLKLKQLKKQYTPNTTINSIQKFKFLKKFNGFLIFAPFIAFVTDLYLWKSNLPVGGVSIALFIYLFAVLEYINYYYIQLSYDNISDINYLWRTKKLKRACLDKDFKRFY
ncbi:general stress protein [Niallia taxi]|uniref:general stress protein n=1 Tax=Niallia taxi TaxID=2499688 RepID=UPI003981CB0F